MTDPQPSLTIQLKPAEGMTPAKWVVMRLNEIVFGPESLGRCVQFAEAAEEKPAGPLIN